MTVSRLLSNPRTAPLLILIGLALVLGLIDPRVLSPANLGTIVIVAAPVVLIALSAMIVLISGGIDLSAGMTATFCAIVMGTVQVTTGSLALTLIAGLAATMAVGLVNGSLVGVLRIPPFIATLATMVMLQGLTLYSTRGGVLIVKDPVLRLIGQGTIFQVPLIVLFAAAAAAICGFVLRNTVPGLRIYAIGSDPVAAKLSGIRPIRQLIVTYLFASLFIFLCACALIGRVPIVTPTMGGTSLLLDALSAAVLGGVSIFGGSGTVVGLVCGALAVSLITTATQIFGLDPSAIGLVKGGIILVMLALNRGIAWVSSRAVRLPA